MVLLTSSTVSVILSSSVVCMFTFLLFLSGYVIQQQSVRSIRIALQTPAPEPLAALRTKRDLDEALFSREQGSSIRNSGNYAYLQLLSNPDPSDICSAILFFKTLAVNGTSILDRLFMYPKEWDEMAGPSSDGNDGDGEATKREKKMKKTNKKKVKNLTKREAKALALLREASVQYNIWLLPIDMSRGGYGTTDTKLLALGQIQFMQYESVLYIQTPGMVVDMGHLDSVLLDRPLPGKHDKNRRESFNNEAWVPMPLRPHNSDSLPPVYLITVNNVKSKGRVEARTHVPNPRLDSFADLVVGPDKVKVSACDRSGSACTKQKVHAGYVYFERDRDGHVKWEDNLLFGSWRAQQYEVCGGLNLDDDYQR